MDIEEIERETLDRERVEALVDDWQRRVNTLLETVVHWAEANGWEVSPGSPVVMDEQLMQEFHIEPREFPSYSLTNAKGRVVWIKPKALWVIGANGRIDLFSSRGLYVIVDLAEAFETPHWVMHQKGKGSGQDFRPELLIDIA